jgi:hypothetical protein
MSAPRNRIVAALWFAGALPAFAATLTEQIDRDNVSAGDAVTLSINVENGAIAHVELPKVDGVLIEPGASSINSAFTGGQLITTTERQYQLVATKPGDYTIPAFDVTLKDGSTLSAPEVKFHVTAVAQTDSTPDQGASAAVQPLLNSLAAANAARNANTVPAPSVPADADGNPVKVFMVITPQTTNAWVGQMVPLRIDFYIAEDSNADQDSLPTIKGSDFMMNDFAVRGHASLIVLEGKPYECDTFLSAFTAPKSGDFPLAAERDTYWVKSVGPSGLDPFGFTRNTNLGHGTITSNQLTMHVRPLPAKGRPEHFSGAVGEFAVAADAQPDVVKFGEPVTLTFGIRGTGNFDYVKCPVLADDPHWKVYAPTSTTNFSDEERTEGSKTFEQSAIPQINGNVRMPLASFSYFNPRLEQYVTVPIGLPTIAVTGAMPIPSTTTAPANPDSTLPPPPRIDDFLPNRTELGNLQSSMTPIYRAAWFWPVQGALALFPMLGLLIFLLRRWMTKANARAGSTSHRRTLRQEENAMAEAVRHGDAPAFFLAARHAVQLQLGRQWDVAPESITLGEIRRRDPALAETVGPLFAQADEVLYSGRAAANLDLAHWQRLARECLQLQPA